MTGSYENRSSSPSFLHSDNSGNLYLSLFRCPHKAMAIAQIEGNSWLHKELVFGLSGKFSHLLNFAQVCCCQNATKEKVKSTTN
jgi:hypothetical protein